MAKMKIERTSDDVIECSFGSKKVIITRNKMLVGRGKWIAYDQNDRYTVSDPTTQAGAIQFAREVIFKQD